MTDKDLQLYERIQQYLEGQLQGKELIDFENQLKTDKALTTEVILHRNLREIVEPEDKQVTQLRNTLQEIRHQSQKKKEDKPTVKIIPFRRIIMSVAAILLLGVIIFFVFINKPLNERLFADNFETEPISFISKSATSRNQIAHLQQVFNNGQYEQSLALATQYLKDNPSDYNVQLSKGLSQLNLKQYEVATQTFQTLDKSDRREAIDKSKWYLAMTYLKLNELTKCKATLQAILDEGGYYPKDKNLLELIEQL